MWPLLSGGQPMTVAMHDAPIKDIAWIPEMNLLASGSWDKTLKYVWIFFFHNSIAILESPAYFWSALFLPIHLTIWMPSCAGSHSWMIFLNSRIGNTSDILGSQQPLVRLPLA